jgi:hypothetical protein
MPDATNFPYLLPLIVSNVFAIFQLAAARKWQKLARWSFVLLFAWAACTNWIISQNTPSVYLEYGELTWSDLYRRFINGWFSRNIQLSVGVIATGQALVAVGLAMKRPWFRIAGSGGIIFLLAILPLGIGAGFPCTAIMALALLLLIRNESNNYLWKKNDAESTNKTILHHQQ